MATERKNRLTTPILDKYGKIGPFFFKEIGLILGLIFLTGFLFITIGGWVKIPLAVFLGTLGSILLVIFLLRVVFIKKISSPWYIFRWVANQVRPKIFKASAFQLEKGKIASATKLVFLSKRKSSPNSSIPHP